MSTATKCGIFRVSPIDSQNFLSFGHNTLAAALIAALAPLARADDGGQWVCGLIGQGWTVPAIAQRLLGDPRVSRLQIEDALWVVVDRDCGPIVLR